MKSSGNSKPEQCVHNLFIITRGEVPYERLKGIESRIIDRPSSIASPDIRADMEWNLHTYEPRIVVDKFNLVSLLSQEGQFGVDTIIINK